MDYEYLPVSTRLSLNARLAIAYILAYLVSGGVMLYWYHYVEPETLEAHPVLTVLFPSLITTLGLLSSVRLYYSLKPDRVRTDKDAIHFVHRKYTTTIPFDTIKELEIYPNGEILFFTSETHGTGPYAITEELTDSVILEVMLSRKIHINRPYALPFIYNQFMRFVITTVAYAALGIHFVTSNTNAIMLTALIYTFYVLFNIGIMVAYRHKGKGIDIPTLCSVLAITLIVLIRTIIIL